MQIAICDDIQKELETIRAALDIYAEAHPELHFDIDEYNTAKDILNAVEKGKTYDVALLDICSPDGLGTDAAVIVTVVCEDEGYAVGVKDTISVANAVLTPEQIQLVNDGEAIEIRVDVKDISDSIPLQDKETVRRAMKHMGSTLRI